MFAKNELDIAVLGNYLNLAHPDAAALHAIQEKYYAHIRFASLLGCGMVGTETGAPNAEYKFCPECRSDAALATFITNFKPVVRCAEQYGVTIAIEPVVRHIVYDARRARTVLDEIGSPNLQILLDPVNLLNMENVDQREEVFAETIELLGKDVAMITSRTFCCRTPTGSWLPPVPDRAVWATTAPFCGLPRNRSPMCSPPWRTPPRKTQSSACNICKNSTTSADNKLNCTLLSAAAGVFIV